MRLTGLPGILRGAGLRVFEVPGWARRGSDEWGPLVGLTCHHTGGSRTSTDAGEIDVLVNGRTGLPGPIAQLYLSRSGAWHVVASGRCNHNKIGWGGPNRGYGNSQLIGVEAQHSGGGEPWSRVQYESYTRGVAALCQGLRIPVRRVAGHREHQPGDKFDPTFDMDDFRRQVLRLIAADDEGGDELSPEEKADLNARLDRIERLAGNADRYGWQSVTELRDEVTGIIGGNGKTVDPMTNILAARLSALEDGQAAIIERLDKLTPPPASPPAG